MAINVECTDCGWKGQLNSDDNVCPSCSSNNLVPYTEIENYVSKFDLGIHQYDEGCPFKVSRKDVSDPKVIAMIKDLVTQGKGLDAIAAHCHVAPTTVIYWGSLYEELDDCLQEVPGYGSS